MKCSSSDIALLCHHLDGSATELSITDLDKIAHSAFGFDYAQVKLRNHPTWRQAAIYTHDELQQFDLNFAIQGYAFNELACVLPKQLGAYRFRQRLLGVHAIDWQQGQAAQLEEGEFEVLLDQELPINYPTIELAGSQFQLKVWSIVYQVPAGRLITYGQIAELLGDPKLARAVGSAVGKNPLAYLIPCHRVINPNGDIGGFKWSPWRKRALLLQELDKAPKNMNIQREMF